LVEGDEAFTVRLSLYNYTSTPFILTRPIVTVTIVNDDTGIVPARLIIPTGGTAPLTVNLGSATAQPVTFTSSNPSVATVPGTVLAAGTTLVDVTAVHPGDAIITATLPPAFGSVTATFDVFVYDPIKLVLTPPTVHLPVGATATIRAEFNPAVSVAEIFALSTIGLGEITIPDNVITVNPAQAATFTIKGVKRGYVILTATLGPGRGSATTSIEIEVDDAPSTPSITQVSPPNGPIAGGTNVTINGANLRADCTVRFGGVPAAGSSFVSANSM